MHWIQVDGLMSHCDHSLSSYAWRTRMSSLTYLESHGGHMFVRVGLGVGQQQSITTAITKGCLGIKQQRYKGDGGAVELPGCARNGS